MWIWFMYVYAAYKRVFKNFWFYIVISLNEFNRNYLPTALKFYKTELYLLKFIKESFE